MFSEARRVALLLLIAAAVGFYNGYPFPTISFFLLVYLCFHLHQLRQLLNWLRQPKLSSIPDGSGLWTEVFELLSRQKRKDKQERKRLKAIIARVQTTTSALKDAAILLNADNTLFWWNKTATKMLKLKAADNGNSIINYLRHPDFVHYLDANDYKIPLTLPSPHNHDRQLEYQITRFGKGETLIVIRDITRIYRLEKMRQDFVGNVSHELRTPLTVIRGYIETMADSNDPAINNNPNWQKALTQMQQQAERMTSLINELTMLSKLETDRNDNSQTQVALQPLLKMICSEARALSGKKARDESNTLKTGKCHTITLDTPSDVILFGNDRELHSAFSNLLTNAIKYSPFDKTIDVQVTFNTEGDLIVSVTDQGIGIEDKHIGRITERFYRVDDSRSKQTGGSGLGLAIVKHVLLRHDAELNIKSTPNKGSTFSCVFPSYRVDQEAILSVR